MVVNLGGWSPHFTICAGLLAAAVCAMAGVQGDVIVRTLEGRGC